MGSEVGVQEGQRPVCKLVDEDGNVFSIIGRVGKVLKKAGLVEKAREFQQRAFGSKSYDEVLQLCFEYVEVE